MLASPTTDPDEQIQRLRDLLQCIDGAFNEVAEKYKQLEKYRAEYKGNADNLSKKVDECASTENEDSKKE